MKDRLHSAFYILLIVLSVIYLIFWLTTCMPVVFTNSILDVPAICIGSR